MRRRGITTAAVIGVVSVGGGGWDRGCTERTQDVRNEAELKQAVQQMMPAVERATHLTFKRRPVVLRRTRGQVRDYVIHKFDGDLPPAELAGAEAAYRLFGLIPDSLDLRRTMIDLLTEHVAGYFDPDSNALYIPADLDPSYARLVISHELVHALQDQYLNLDSLVTLKRQNDRRSAAQAILEGQATLAQILVLMPEQKLESLPNFWDLRTTLWGSQGGGEGMKVFASVPLWLRESLIFPYLGGAEFVRWFQHEYPGKQPYGPLMPVSTAQILHPARYAAGDRPDAVTFLPPASDTVRYEDGLGEFEIRLLLEQYLGNDSAAALLANGWAGDRYQVLGRRGDVLVWYTLWESRASAERFQRAVGRVWVKRRAGARFARRWEIRPLVLSGVRAVRLVDAPPAWVGWRHVPQARVVRTAR
ncbi:MAG TPA: hypothetical protein VM736_03500 [Gemmatimonadales bacterium]|nr:hypothetical protein [Gemmatimonadales bacterium]